MDTGYKHFSHAHNLVIHQAHEAANMSCTGCNFLVMGTTYVCWQCNFVLHEQCFSATRSLTHPSHPSHPLTLLPYPTYASNSFYCNSCGLAGTGLSYTCSDCEFDLHVSCASSTSDMPEQESAYDREQIQRNKQRLEAKREQYRIEALGRQNALDNI